MSIERPAFTPTRLQEDRANDKGKVITIRLNEAEAKLLEDIKFFIDTPSDGTAIKICWFLGWRVLQHDLGSDNIKWLSRLDRVRLNVPKSGSGGG